MALFHAATKNKKVFIYYLHGWFLTQSIWYLTRVLHSLLPILLERLFNEIITLQQQLPVNCIVLFYAIWVSVMNKIKLMLNNHNLTPHRVEHLLSSTSRVARSWKILLLPKNSDRRSRAVNVMWNFEKYLLPTISQPLKFEIMLSIYSLFTLIAHSGLEFHVRKKRKEIWKFLLVNGFLFSLLNRRYETQISSFYRIHFWHAH